MQMVMFMVPSSSAIPHYDIFGCTYLGTPQSLRGGVYAFNGPHIRQQLVGRSLAHLRQFDVTEVDGMCNLADCGNLLIV